MMPAVHIPKPRILLPVPKAEWRTPSRAQPKDCFGNENRTRFRLRARLHDGHVVWRGWFDDRDDADAFLTAIALGTLHQQPDLWRLPTPQWYPDLGERLSYDFATVTFLTSPTGSNQTYTSPSDWNNSNNNIQTLGSGGSGGVVVTTSGGKHVTGGGGGAWNKTTNLSFATPGTTTATYRIATGATAASSTTFSVGNDGGDSWFNGTTLAASSVGSKGGLAGGAAAGSVSGGAGGTGLSGIGSSSNNGGRGGNLTGASGSGASGGGGAAGSTGAGNAGADSTSTSTVYTNGGSGDAGSGGSSGTGSATVPTSGGDGTEWDGSHGSGGGGGGSGLSSTPGNGGNYGAGGGAMRLGSGTATSGAGIQGIIVVTYTPLSTYTSGWGNLAMMGM